MRSFFDYTFFLIFISLKIIGVKTMFITISATKFKPISAVSVKVIASAPPEIVAMPFKKNSIQPTKNIPVLTNGQAIAESITAKLGMIQAQILAPDAIFGLHILSLNVICGDIAESINVSGYLLKSDISAATVNAKYLVTVYVNN